MFQSTRSLTLFAALLLAAVSGDALSKDIEVPDDYPTINQAIGAAHPGDTIEISSGTYYERVYVPSNLTGLRIEGKGTAVIDAHPSKSGGYGPALRIMAKNVRVTNLTLRQARTTGSSSTHKGNGATVYGAGVLFEKVRAESCEEYGFYASAHGARFENCVASSNDGGFGVIGNKARLLKCQAIGNRNYGIVVDAGTGSRVQDCLVRNSSIFGIYLSSEKGRVEDCEVMNCATGIISLAASAKIDDNEVRGFSTDGIHVLGSGTLVRKNEVRHGVRTKSTGVNGIYVKGDNIKVKENSLEDVFGSGILLSYASGSDVLDNKLTRCGYLGAEAAIRVEKSNYTGVVDNTVSASVWQGIRVYATSYVLVSDNKVSDGMGDGIRVGGGSYNIVLDNQVSGCRAEGIENTGTNTDMRENKCQKNRLDVANKGSFSKFSKNKYQTGGAGTAPQIQD